ncbi:MAG: hypothetical protein UW81_C0024G0017 [Candidatus Giovannonibacteria bacterium GW2011_GWC2_44_9]|uniref:Rod shape-determining protein MreC beta-barrel core domain-containing protein n=3 Tax=Candidatus Giovannoniibacteriota TaxID=1752738 RepID=A0A0G1IY52_9BACT|nr:MAG: hypothetical protein UW49_C0004G0029 [Candidatus Giovannonibacteria bacterium GW2011_GWB1_44_23]KKT63918.1 MAG: hypothetical protein UW57_C0004G0028 [Candidatus Giovannonibacteria bacterium GW2011_GWA1_44_29]KKT83169.1 MAG: hypothetical protein UW81_C0024G0017 [Candidatus Giovannonibacteria bacterium GW2011_GWC2_44_9]KKT91631.1 MAG: hypothetical protein UW93_C0004G0029 [Parcubacteria group bacterium GW2011_GWC1_45_13]
MLVFFGGSRGFIKNLIIKASLFLVPERESRQASNQALALLIKIRDLERENLKLKKALGVNGKNRLIPANIVFGGGYLFSDILFINQGENAGIKIGDLVTYQNKILIGRITEVGADWSKAALLGHVGDKITLRQDALENIQFVPMEATGRGGGEFQMEMPAETNLKIGDIFRSAENPEYIAGVVDRISSEFDEPFKEISVISPVSPVLLDEVDIISKND